MKICKRCKKEFSPTSNNQVYCSEECRKRVYKIKKRFYPSDEYMYTYKEKIKEEEGLDDSEYNYLFRERTASNKGMTTTEYNAYLEREKAKKLGLTLSQLRHFCYLARKNHTKLYEELGLSYEDYKRKLKNRF